ncbi:hypothetical protein D3C78_1790350 [compost metagenome]
MACLSAEIADLLPFAARPIPTSRWLVWTLRQAQQGLVQPAPDLLASPPLRSWQTTFSLFPAT